MSYLKKRKLAEAVATEDWVQIPATHYYVNSSFLFGEELPVA